MLFDALGHYEASLTLEILQIIAKKKKKKGLRYNDFFFLVSIVSSITNSLGLLVDRLTSCMNLFSFQQVRPLHSEIMNHTSQRFLPNLFCSWVHRRSGQEVAACGVKIVANHAPSG